MVFPVARLGPALKFLIARAGAPDVWIVGDPSNGSPSSPRRNLAARGDLVLNSNIMHRSIPVVAALAGCAALTSCVALTSCKLIDAPPPRQTERVNPVAESGARDFAQRKRDCWDMPSAVACYEVGLNFELGLTVETDREEAAKYYAKACELDREPDHCKAARRLKE